MPIALPALLRTVHTAFSPLTSPMIMSVMPVHHMGLLRYAWPSPTTLPCLAVELSRPFFLITKLGACQLLGHEMLLRRVRIWHASPSCSPGTDEQSTSNSQTHSNDLKGRVGGVDQ